MPELSESLHGGRFVEQTHQVRVRPEVEGPDHGLHVHPKRLRVREVQTDIQSVQFVKAAHTIRVRQVRDHFLSVRTVPVQGEVEQSHDAARSDGPQGRLLVLGFASFVSLRKKHLNW